MRVKKKGVKVWGAMVVLVVFTSCFGWTVGSEEARSYNISAYIEQDSSLFNTTQEPNEVTNLSWVNRIHDTIHSNIKISENESDVADVTYDNASIIRRSDVTPLDANNNRIEDSLELKASDVSVPKVDVIVLYNHSVDLAPIDYSSIDAEIKYDYSVINATAITIPSNKLHELSKIQNVQMVYEDHEVYAYLDSSVSIIKADTARTAYNVTGSNVTIAVIDTGIDDAHESLDDMDDNPATNDPKVIGFKDFVNFYPDPYDDHGHGTHCAGIATGTGGSSVYKGVAPGAKLVGVKVLNAWGSGSESTVIAGIDWTVQNKDDYGIKIISMSLGRDYNNDGTTPMALACDAAVDAGIVVSVAAGNAGMGSKTVGDPACAKKVVTVGAIDDSMEIAYFSSRGPTADGRIKPEVCAVGVDVTSAERDTGDGYIAYSGTSMATPHIAGVAALMLEYNPNLAPLEVREILMDTAVDRGVIGPDNVYGWGVVDAMFALPLALPQEHDIKLSDLQAPDYVKPNDIALVNATVCNVGMSTEKNISVGLSVNGTLVNNTTISFLENGTNTSVYFTWSTPSIEGMYNLTVYVVPVYGENITINNQKTRRVSVTSAKPIALFKDRDPWGYASNEEVLIKYGLPYTVFTSSDMESVNLSEYGKIVIASQQPYSFYFKLEQNRPWFEAYISNGSVFELHGAEWSSDDWSGLVMPGNFTSILDFSNDVTFNMPNHVILKYPNVITAAELDWWNYATHGWLTNFSIKPITIITQEPTKNPCLVEFPYGDGYIVATMQTLEWAYALGYSPFLENVILYLPVRQEHDILVGITVPEVLKFNETNTIGANVWNIGLSDETNVAINFTVDGVLLERKTIPFIQNGTDTTISFNWAPTAVGWYNVSVYAEPVPGEDYVINNLATCSAHVPEAVLTDEYVDYGIDLDGDGLFDYLAIDVGVNIAEAGHYYLYSNLETLKEFYITDASNDTYLSVGKQNLTLLFNGIDIRRVDLNGPYTLCDLELRDNYWNTLDKRLKAYNTSFYNSKEFQLPKAMFTDVYNDTGVDTDNDTYYNYLSIDIGVNVSESGYYYWYGELYDSYGDSIAYEGNSSYLENGTQIIGLKFKGVEIYMHGVDGPYYLKYLMLYDDDYAKQDCRHDAHTTRVYNYTDFQRPPAEFNDIYADNGKDTDGDGLYNYLTIDVGVAVRSAGYYQVDGRLDDNFGNYIEWRSNYTYLNAGNQTVQLDFDGIKIRQNGVNGTFDLRYLYLYNTTDWIQLDYRYYAYTTSHYNWTDFQRPPAEFNDIYADNGKDTDGDGLYNYLTIDVSVAVRSAGYYQVDGRLDDNFGNYIEWRSNYTYLNAGNQTVQLDFDGIKIWQSRTNGTFDLRYLGLYNASDWNLLDYRYYAYTTKSYNYTDFRPPAVFMPGISDYGLDTDGNGLYDYLVVEKQVNVTTTRNYELDGYLYNSSGYYIGSAYNYTTLDAGVQNITLRFDGVRIYRSNSTGNFTVEMYLYGYSTSGLSSSLGTEKIEKSFVEDKSIIEPRLAEIKDANISSQNIKPLAVNLQQLVGISTWRWLDSARDLTKYYNYTQFERPPARFNDVYSDRGLDTDSDGLYDYLAIDVGVNVSKAGYYYVSGELYNSSGWYVDSVSNYTTLNAGNQTVQLRFDGARIWRSRTNGTFDLRYLGLYNASDWSQPDYRYYAYTTKSYNYTDWRPPAVFMPGIMDYGFDENSNGLYDYLVVEKQVNVTTAGNYELDSYLVNNSGYGVDSDYNYTYLSAGIHNLTIKFEGYKIYNSKSTGNFTVEMYLYGYSTSGLSASLGSEKREKSFAENKSIIEPRLAEIKDANIPSQNIKPLAVNSQQLVGVSTWRWLDSTRDITRYYNFTEFEQPPARFNDQYSDFGEDTDGDGLYNYLTIDVGVAVRSAGYYQVEGRLDDNFGNYIEWRSNYTYLNAGNQTVQLDFDGIKIRQSRTNGTFDLRNLGLYNASDWEQLDYRYYAYTTKYYNWTEFQPPSAEFRPGFNDFGLDTNNNTLYDYLMIEKEIKVRKTGNYELYGSLRAPSGKGLDSDSNYTYLYEGLHNVTLKFYGPSIYLSGESGNFDVHMDLYDRDNGRWLGWETNSTSYYNYTDFERLPAEFTGNFSDYGLDIDNDTLYNYLLIEAEINVTKAGEYELSGDLWCYDEDSTPAKKSFKVSATTPPTGGGGGGGGVPRAQIDWDSNRTYLEAGIHNITLDFDGIKIYNAGYNGSFRTWLNLYETEEWHRIDEMEYFINDYNYTDFQRPPAEFNDIYSDYGTDTDGDGFFDYLVINVGVDVREVGDYWIYGELYENGTYNYLDYDSITTYLNEGTQTVQLRFEGIKIRNNEYNGTYDLKYLELYNVSYPYPTPTPTPASQHESKSTGAENVSVQYGEQLDYRYYAYTTAHYKYTEFQTIPSCYTYTKEYVAYSWDEISAPEQIWTGCDDCSYNYVLPWNFTFFCENHSSIQISTNGLITFPPDASSHCCSPDLENTVAIAPFWGDLSQACGEGTNISVQNKGDRVVVVWYTGTFGGGCLNKDLFEVILYENGKIRFSYNYLNNIPYSVGAGISNAFVYYNDTWDNSTSVVYSPINDTEPLTIFDTDPGTYPSISGTHNGTITLNKTITVSKLYTYPCSGTGGHTEYARIYNTSGTIAEASWSRYEGDWQNLSFNNTFTLYANHTYNYTIRTGSYPQIHHTAALETENGWINCTSFTDANGKWHDKGIPAIKLGA